MPSKQGDKVEVSEEKSAKKNTVSSGKTKKVLARKAVKKAAIGVAQKVVKTKVVSKKTELGAKTKFVRTKVGKANSVRKKIIKDVFSEKNDHEEKSEIEKKYDLETVVKEEKATPKKESAIIKGQETVILHSPMSSDATAGYQESKQKPIEPESSVPKTENPKTAIKSTEAKPGTVKDNYKGIILINELITVRELADKMKLMFGDVLKKLLSMGSLATINQRLDTDTAILLAKEFDYDARFTSIYSEEEINSKEDSSKLKQRPPVVTIMGHVDHGKTSLLDAIRSSDVIAGEHGRITQHIGAYKVKVSSGDYIAFLDTPGHEVFTAMRSRGAQATDIVVLVISAADGVMPQTVEAINHAKAANVPIIVAVNKIDLPSSDTQKVRQELSNYGLVPEEWGGDTIMIDISAKQKTNINSLLEMILLKAEMMELKANPDKKAEGVVIEAKLDSRRGPVATLLVQGGTLRVVDNLVIGTTYGKVRAMIDDRGKRFNEAPPSTPVEILGMNEPPHVGDKFIVVDNESQAREITRSRKGKIKEASLKPRHHLSLADINMRQVKDLRIVLKADVQGSLGALSDALERLSTSEISLKIIHMGAGAITESDIALAVASNALVVGFNLRPDTVVEKLAEAEGVSINVYRIIYDLIADVKAAMEGLLDPDVKEKVLGRAVVKQVFRLSSYGIISGCSVTDGQIQRGIKIRLLRNNIIVFEGNISSLKRFKDDVKEVEKGYECGIGLENFSDVKPGDIIENFSIEKIVRKLDN
ncbi:translation initiation factor IF-2 [Candidatus Endomicrobiellum trichonymphae]|uniref:Translation initiation factor IF-2 n=1 Tax=Endomicrobium trichonymphae TaxID=1408204 RepID=B1GZN6_ENDTX|nr:translation initiation factor IF-2 [Candidatus Endomicrobium trichonymphae]BAG13718.1 translation initiation factor IF-2 [Candidatus Endomicrobium trichonymphae]